MLKDNEVSIHRFAKFAIRFFAIAQNDKLLK
jgi:hypothetical protein